MRQSNSELHRIKVSPVSYLKHASNRALMKGVYSFFLPLVYFDPRVLMLFDIATVPLPVIVSAELKG